MNNALYIGGLKWKTKLKKPLAYVTWANKHISNFGSQGCVIFNIQFYRDLEDETMTDTFMYIVHHQWWYTNYPFWFKLLVGKFGHSTKRNNQLKFNNE